MKDNKHNYTNNASVPTLFNELKNKLDKLEEKYDSHLNKELKTVFPRQLFRENFAQLSQYLEEMRQTLSSLQKIQHNLPQFTLLAEKFLGQYHAIMDALSQTPKVPQKTTTLNRREQIKQELNKLPPRERLERYYQYLQQFNEKITDIEDKLYQTDNTELKNQLTKILENTKIRQKKCLEAIELLEEYLSMMDENEAK